MNEALGLPERAIRYYATHPVEYVQDIIRVNPDPEQSKILRSLVDNQMTSVRSGHGIGKSAVEAWAVIWFMTTRDFPKIPCTAPTQHQLFDILWAEISKWRRNNPALERELIWTKEKLYMRGYAEEWFAVARTASKPDALQGFHAENVLYIIDEASGVSDKIFEPVLGSLSTKGARLLMCGNPTQLSGFFYESHHKNRESYKTFHIDGRNSSRVDHDYVDMIINMYGEDSDVFRVRVAGDFPKQEHDVFIPLSLVESRGSRLYELQPGQGLSYVSIGCDVARFGDDETVIYRNIKGVCKLACERHGQDLMRTTGDLVDQYMRIVEEYPNFYGKIYVMLDDTGLGGGVTDRLREVKKERKLNRMQVIPINAAEKIETDSAEGKKEAERYNNLTTAMWANIKELLRQGDIVIEEDEKTIAQLSGRKYRMASNGKVELESKQDMKKRGLSSPDRADALALSLYMGKIKRATGSAPDADALAGLHQENYWG